MRKKKQRQDSTSLPSLFYSTRFSIKTLKMQNNIHDQFEEKFK